MIIKIILLLTLNLNLIYCATWFGNFSSFSSWNIRHSNLAEMRDIVNDPKGGPDKVLRVKYSAGSYWTSPSKGGTQFYIYPLENIVTGHVSFEFEVLFPSNFDFVKGGKLPGLFGGRPGCSGGDSALDCFSGRFMWGPSSSGYCYLYIPKNVAHLPEFCQLTGFPKCDQQYGFGLAGRANYFPKDKWNKIKETIKLNTPGQANGRLTISVNGNQIFDYDKIIFRTTNSISINGIMFETCKYIFFIIYCFSFLFLY